MLVSKSIEFGGIHWQHELLSTTHAANPKKVLYSSPSTQTTRYQQLKQAKRENAFDSHQTLITNFYQLTTDIATKMDKLATENQHLRMMLQEYRVRFKNLSNGTENKNEKYNFSSTNEFLNKIWEVVDTKSRTKQGHIKKYDEQLKQFSTYLYIITGALAYETLSANLSLPSLETVKKKIQSSNDTIIEGEIRADILKGFLTKRKLCPQIWLSEDATKIVNKIEYDSTTDQIIGLVLPIDQNGMPVKFSFRTENVAKLQHSLLNYTKAEYVYTVMARCLNVNTPSFCLSLFGTDNKFTTGQVLKRWSYTERVVGSEEIDILGWASDGDTRCLRAMLIRNGLPFNPRNVPNQWKEWFNAYFQPDIICVQDTHHICSKLKNRLYDNTAVIILGRYTASKSHLKILIDTISKDKHLLVPSDIRPLDKMNFKPVLKIMNPIVRSHLKEHVPASLGTSIYLGLMENIYKSYIDENLKPLERVYCLWYTIFFLRLWRLWLVEHKTLSLKNFITYNSYASIELNGHSLINIIVKLRSSGRDDQFVTTLMGSQTCEEFYRSLRSLTSTHWTAINFTLLEMLHKVKRIEYAQEAIADLSSSFKFPRSNLKKAVYHKLPADDEIYDIVMKAKDDALKDTTDIGMKIKTTKNSTKKTPVKSAFSCQLSSIRIKADERIDFEVDDELFEFEDEYPSDVSDSESGDEGDDVNVEQDETPVLPKVPEDITAILNSHGGSINLKEFVDVKGTINGFQV